VAESTPAERAVEAMAGEPAGGLIVMPDSFTMTHRETIVTLAARHRVPTVYPFGCLPLTAA
jgi:putative ABC transport system substrate-binding protein